MKKKLILVLSMVAFVVCLLAISVSAVEIDGIDYTFSGTEAFVNNGNKDCAKINVVIPSTVTHEGVTYTVTKINDSAFRGNKTVVTLVTPSTIKSIGEHAFREMSALEKITLNGSAELLYLNNAEVYQCKALKKADLSGMVGLIDMGNGGTYDHTFTYCSSLTEVILPDSLKVIGNSVFNGCSSLASIELPDGLTTIKSSSFAGCALTNVVLPSTVNYIGDYAFQSCNSLVSLNIPVGVTYLGCNNFQYTKVTKVIVPSTVTGAGKDMFNSVTGLNTVVLGNADVSGYNGTFFTSCGPLNYVFYAGSDPSVLTTKYSALSKHELVTYEQYIANLRNPEFGGYAGKILVYGTKNCASCGDVDTSEEGFLFDSLTDYMYEGKQCNNCGAKSITKEYAPVFECLGFSTFANNGYCAMVQGFRVNYDSLAKYNEQFADAEILGFGVLAVAENKVDGSVFDENGDAVAGSIVSDITTGHNYFEIKVSNIPMDGMVDENTAYVDAKLYMCAFVRTEAGALYIDNGYVGETLGTAISYNDVK